MRFAKVKMCVGFVGYLYKPIEKKNIFIIIYFYIYFILVLYLAHLTLYIIFHR